MLGVGKSRIVGRASTGPRFPRDNDDDDEELTEDDRRALRASQDYFRNGGKGILFEQVVEELGFTMGQVRNHTASE